MKKGRNTGNMTTHILIADSSSLTVVGAESLLKGRVDTVVRKTENGDDLLALARRITPDLILLGDGFDPLFDTLHLVERLREVVPSVRLIIMGSFIDGLVIRDLFSLGISAYLALSDNLSECLMAAVDSVLQDRPYLSPTANTEFLIAMQGKNRNWYLDAEARGILRLLASGCTPHQIAVKLSLKRRRVYWVIEKMRARFGAATNEHLITRACAEGFAGFPD